MGLEAGDANLYRYVSNNPVKYNDPSGLFRFDTSAGEGSSPRGTVQGLNAFINSPYGQEVYNSPLSVRIPDYYRRLDIDGQTYDAQHVMAAYQVTNTLGGSDAAAAITSQLGALLEINQFSEGSPSAFSSEDIRSNILGTNAALSEKNLIDYLGDKTANGSNICGY